MPAFSARGTIVQSAYHGGVRSDGATPARGRQTEARRNDRSSSRPPRISTLEASDEERTDALRDRYLTLVLQARALRDAPRLPARPPDAAELEQPWRETQ
jgi:hypothetical protein